MIKPVIEVGCEIVYAKLEKGNFWSFVNCRRGWVRHISNHNSYSIDYEDQVQDPSGNIDIITNSRIISTKNIYAFMWGGLWVNNPLCSERIKDQLL